MIRRTLICFAFSTWCFLNSWVALADRRTTYFLSRDPARTIVPQVLISEILLTTAMLAAWAWIGRLRRRLADALFLITCLVPVGIAATALLRLSPLDLTAVVQARWFWPAVAAVSIAPLILIARQTAAVSRTMRSVFLWSWPAIGLLIVEAALHLLRFGPAAYADLPLAQRLPDAPGRPRVVWIIFDEMSQAVAFTHRPRALDLPNFDRLKSESFFATAAIAPAGATLLSMPALTLGEDVTRAEPAGPSRLLLQTPDHPAWFSWTSRSNVFDDARTAGFNAAVIGWYHPYGRLLNRSLTDCFWTANAIDPGAEESFDALPFPQAIANRAWLQLSNLPLLGHLKMISPRRSQSEVHRRDFEELMRRARAAAADPQIGLSLLHLPVPHPPAIDDRPNSAGYIDNLAVADRALGELRRSMEQAGLWDRTAIIISADHGWRIPLWRPRPEWTAAEEAFARIDTSGVPFIVKMPRSTDETIYLPRFDTALTRQLIGGILEGRVNDTPAVAAFVDRHR